MISRGLTSWNHYSLSGKYTFVVLDYVSVWEVVSFPENDCSVARFVKKTFFKVWST